MDEKRDFSFYLSQCLVMAVLWLGRVIFHALSTATSHKATFAVLGEIRKRCMEKLSRMPLGAVLSESSGALKNTLVERIDSIETTLAHVVPEFTANLLVPVIMEIYIFSIDWRMGLASLATVPVGLITPLVTLMSYSDDLRTMSTIFGEVRAILDAPEMVRPAEGNAPKQNDLELRDVHFAYHSEQEGADIFLAASGSGSPLPGPC